MERKLTPAPAVPASAGQLLGLAYDFAAEQASDLNPDSPADVAYYEGMLFVLRSITSADSPDANDILAGMTTYRGEPAISAITES